MKITAWRITPKKYIDDAFTGEGAKLWGGRWNQVGYPAVYCAEHLSLAILELIVHLEDDSDISAFVAIPVVFSPKLVQSLRTSELPPTWNDLPISPASTIVGKKWLEENKLPVFKVPSAIVPIESNFVLNPTHPDFKLIEIGAPQEIRFDNRIVTQSRRLSSLPQIQGGRRGAIVGYASRRPTPKMR
jgi:RES domain-containing protein